MILSDVFSSMRKTLCTLKASNVKISHVSQRLFFIEEGQARDAPDGKLSPLLMDNRNTRGLAVELATF